MTAALFERPYAFISTWDRAMEMLLACLLCFGPLALGSVQPWSELVLLLLVSGLAAVFVARLLLDPHAPHLRWSWTYVPVMAFLAVVALQLLPLPWGILGTLSPATLSMRQELLKDLPSGIGTSSPLSFYPYATWHDLRLLTAAGVLFVVLTNTVRSRFQVRRLLAVIAIVGGIVTLIALAQDLSGTKLIYGQFPTHGHTAGPYQNYNNYSQFANLSMGAALALLLLKINDRTEGRSLSWRRFSDLYKLPEGLFTWLLSAAIVLGAASVALSTSRMGFMSMLVAAVVAAIVVRKTQGAKGRGSVLAIFAFAFLCLLLILGFEAVYDRLATLQEIEGDSTPYSSRWHTLVDLVPIWAKFPLLGLGQGAHPFAFHMFDHSGDFVMTGHVENEYAQALEETGILGLGIVLSFAFLIIRAFLAAIRGQSRMAAAVAIGAGYGLTAVFIHSLSDFGQHVPSIAFLTTTLCALLVNVSPARWHKDPEAAEHSRHHRSSSHRQSHLLHWLTPAMSFKAALATLAIALPVLGVLFLSLSSAYAATRGDAFFTTALQIESRLAGDNWQGDDVDFARLIDSAQKASNAQPGNIQYATALSSYRWRAICTQVDPATRQLLFDQVSLGYARRIADEISSARALCPTYGPAWSLLGQIQLFVLSDPTGEGRIATGYRLAPYDVSTCYAAGMADVLAGRLDASLEKFHRLADAGAVQSAAAVYVCTCSRPDLAIALAGDDPPKLLSVANVLQQHEASKGLWALANDRARMLCTSPDTPGKLIVVIAGLGRAHGDPAQVLAIADLFRYDSSRDLAATARAQAADRLRAICAAPDAPANMLAALAGLCATQDDHASAASYYRRALDLEYGRLDWRIALARSLAKTQDTDQAMKEARICLHLKPGYWPARQLVGDLALMAGAAADEK